MAKHQTLLRPVRFCSRLCNYSLRSLRNQIGRDPTGICSSYVDSGLLLRDKDSGNLLQTHQDLEQGAGNCYFNYRVTSNTEGPTGFS